MGSLSYIDADGVLSSEMIGEAMAEGVIANGSQARLQPASLDLAFAARAWRVRASFLPGRRRRVSERLDDGLAMQAIDLSGGAVLERGCVYLVELAERLALPSSIRGGANPKSSTGRIDVFVRLVTDYGDAFDDIPAGYDGPLYAEVSPRSFSVIVREGSSLNQLRLKSGDWRISDADLNVLHSNTPLVEGEAKIDGGLGLCVALSDASDIVGWRARRHAALIDVDAPGVLDPHDYFEALAPQKSGFLILDPDEFYILRSKESLAIPSDYAAEMTPISPGLGEFRVHYAGFFDPGFGWSEGGANGSRAVLEVRSRETPFVLEDGQLVARLVYEKMAARPSALYGESLGSNYQGQGLKLSKHFK
ncbi:MAG: 2'-deoxycytidine 5'-triphosphate deaminase [Pseudomonadota bacterium]